MAQRGIPIIHLLNVSEIARRYGLPDDPAQQELDMGSFIFVNTTIAFVWF